MSKKENKQNFLILWSIAHCGGGSAYKKLFVFRRRRPTLHFKEGDENK
jgi:hypothetical protein